MITRQERMIAMRDRTKEVMASGFRSKPYSVSDEDIEDTIMLALERQFAAMKGRTNEEEDLLWKRTSHALGLYYSRIAKRKLTAGKATHKSKKFYNTNN